MALEIANEVISKYRHSKLPKSKAKLLEGIELLLIDLSNENAARKDYVREETKKTEAISSDFGRDRHCKW